MISKQDYSITRKKKLTTIFASCAIQFYTTLEQNAKILCFDLHRDQVHLPFTWSHGMRTFSCSWTVRKTQARRSREPGICSTPCGFLTSLWSGSRRTRTGPWWTLMSAQGYMIAGGRSLRPCIKSRSHKSLFAIFNPVWLLYALYLIICWVSYYMYFFCQRIFYDIKTEMFLNYKQNYNKRLNNWSCV